MNPNVVSIESQVAGYRERWRTSDESLSCPISMSAARMGADFLLLCACSMAGGAIGHALQLRATFWLSPQQLIAGSALYSALVLSLLVGDNAYPRVCSLLSVKETEIALRVSIKAILVCLMLSIVARYPVPRMATLSAWTLSTVYLTVGRGWIQNAIGRRFAASFPKRRTLIYGTRRTARRFFTGVLHSPVLGVDPVGFIPSSQEDADFIYSNDYFQRDSRPVFREPLCVEMLKRLEIEQIAVCDALTEPELSGLYELTQAANCELSVVNNNQERVANRPPTWVWEMDGLFVTTSARNEPTRFYHLTKRLVDLVGSAVLILLSLPMWMLIAAMIRLESKGPIFFRQTRIGQDGKPFEMLKFRSMRVDAPKYACSPRTHADPRITRVGRILRLTSIDEVPQLINVLKGDMSLVGPRPEMPFIIEEYGPLEASRLSVPQGITGFWQLSADRRYAIHESLEYDLYYIQNRTVLMDIAILLHTLVYAAKGI